MYWLEIRAHPGILSGMIYIRTVFAGDVFITWLPFGKFISSWPCNELSGYLILCSPPIYERCILAAIVASAQVIRSYRCHSTVLFSRQSPVTFIYHFVHPFGSNMFMISPRATDSITLLGNPFLPSDRIFTYIIKDVLSSLTLSQRWLKTPKLFLLRLTREARLPEHSEFLETVQVCRAPE